jgi:hypothetical protein
MNHGHNCNCKVVKNYKYHVQEHDRHIQTEYPIFKRILDIEKIGNFAPRWFLPSQELIKEYEFLVRKQKQIHKKMSEHKKIALLIQKRNFH